MCISPDTMLIDASYRYIRMDHLNIGALLLNPSGGPPLIVKAIVRNDYFRGRFTRIDNCTKLSAFHPVRAPQDTSWRFPIHTPLWTRSSTGRGFDLRVEGEGDQASVITASGTLVGTIDGSCPRYAKLSPHALAVRNIEGYAEVVPCH